MNAKQRNAVERVRRDLARIEKSLDNLDDVFNPPSSTGRVTVTKGKRTKPTMNLKGTRNGMSKKGGQK